MQDIVHCYQNRHVFVGDHYAGKYNFGRHELYLLPAFEAEAQRIGAFFALTDGRPAPGIHLGEDEVAPEPPLVEFPREILKLRNPRLGFRTPAVLKWAAKHLTPAEFLRRYPDGGGYSPEELDALRAEGPKVVPIGSEPVPPKQEPPKQEPPKSDPPKSGGDGKLL